MTPPPLLRRLVAEFAGTGLLVTAVVGSGIMAAKLSPQDVGLQLLENSTATVFALAALILIFGPVSGAHFNPVVSIADWWLGRRAGTGLRVADLGAYLLVQTAGAIGGSILANLMFALPAVHFSAKQRAAGHLWLGEVVATTGLILLIFALARSGRALVAPAAVGVYIGAAYWFTSSTSFANPAVTIGRAFTDTFAGIAPGSVPGFVVSQLVGLLVAAGLLAVLYPQVGRGGRRGRRPTGRRCRGPSGYRPPRGPDPPVTGHMTAQPASHGHPNPRTRRWPVNPPQPVPGRPSSTVVQQARDTADGHPRHGADTSVTIDSMTAEISAELLVRARIHAALGEPSRLAIVDALTLGDASPGELGTALGLPTNLLAHHLGVLQEAGVVERSRSEGDRRRSYLRLRHDALTTLAAAAARPVARVVFVCTHNSARSQLAVALWATRSTVPAASAGTRPAARVHPRAVRVGRRHSLALHAAKTAHVRDMLRDDDLVIAVCDNAHEHLAAAATSPTREAGQLGTHRLHWSVPDPALVDTDTAFEAAYADIAGRIDRLASTLTPADRSPPTTRSTS